MGNQNSIINDAYSDRDLFLNNTMQPCFIKNTTAKYSIDLKIHLKTIQDKFENLKS